MAHQVKDMSVDDLRDMIQDTVRQTLEDYLEDLQALASPSYIASIEEAREDYRQGRTVRLEDAIDG
ncbi:MAG TPA: hypothetical protein VGX68_20595 [Thermoanaerobaculia bacterium]|jgi:hypothetical protein|nr:hypothetical protein [Thermoanaerobaculia bacterium]